MKKTTRILAFTSATLLAATSLFACGKQTVSDDENTLEIYVTELGNGKKWLEEMETVFETENPDIDIVITSDKGVELAVNKVLSGPKVNTADLMFTSEDWEGTVLKGASAVEGYEYALADVTGFLETEIEGVKLKDKFRDYSLKSRGIEMEAFDYEPHYFTLPDFAGAQGIIYNLSLFEEKGWAIPRTTNELIALCKTVTDAGYIAFCNDSTTGYTGYLPRILWGQYDGAEYYYEYISPNSEDDWFEYSTNPSSKGRLYATIVAEDLFSKDAGFVSPTIQQDDFARAQGRLIAGEGAMAINGSWFDNEMSLAIKQGNEQGNNYKTGMMKTPIISCIVDKLDFWSKEYNRSYYESIGDGAISPMIDVFDNYLADIVDYVDGKTAEMPAITIGTNVYTATETDISLIKEARSCYDTVLGKGGIVIPSYAKAKNAAFKFLEFFYSDRGSEIIIDNLNGGLSAVKYDYTKWSGYTTATQFQKDVFDIISNGTPISIAVGRYYGLPGVKSNFFTYSKTDSRYQTAEQSWTQSCWSKQEFIDFMISAGLM